MAVVMLLLSPLFADASEMDRADSLWNAANEQYAQGRVAALVLAIIFASLLNNRDLKFRGLFRTCIFLPCATGLVAYSMIFRTLFTYDGMVNAVLMNIGILSEPINWLNDPNTAKAVIILGLIWRWTGYNMVFFLSGMQGIEYSIYEAARIDGANAMQMYGKITLPYMLFVTGPYLLTSFTGNINNFNVIYLLTRGDPLQIGNTAGDTDLLVTWLYKLTVDQQKFNMGAVIGIFTFVVLAVVSLITYRSSGSYKDEEAFK